jgi:hypothetical protein
MAVGVSAALRTSLHESGHALIAAALRLPVTSVELLAGGGGLTRHAEAIGPPSGLIAVAGVEFEAFNGYQPRIPWDQSEDQEKFEGSGLDLAMAVRAAFDTPGLGHLGRRLARRLSRSGLLLGGVDLASLGSETVRLAGRRLLRELGSDLRERTERAILNPLQQWARMNRQCPGCGASLHRSHLSFCPLRVETA